MKKTILKDEVVRAVGRMVINFQGLEFDNLISRIRAVNDDRIRIVHFHGFFECRTRPR